MLHHKMISGDKFICFCVSVWYPYFYAFFEITVPVPSNLDIIPHFHLQCPRIPLESFTVRSYSSLMLQCVSFRYVKGKVDLKGSLFLLYLRAYCLILISMLHKRLLTLVLQSIPDLEITLVRPILNVESKWFASWNLIQPIWPSDTFVYVPICPLRDVQCSS